MYYTSHLRPRAIPTGFLLPRLSNSPRRADRDEAAALLFGPCNASVSKNQITTSSHPIYLHESPADEGDTDHEQPARDNGENINKSTNEQIELEGSQGAVKGLEHAIIGRLLLVLLLGVDLDDLVRRDSSRVKLDDVHVGRGLRLAFDRDGESDVPD